MGTRPFETLENLQAYQVAREFRKDMYAVARRLPDVEKYGLAGQMRRAAVSLTNNIPEGHGRHHFRDQLKFLIQARGSLEELADDLNICDDEQYLPVIDVNKLKEKGAQVQRVINGYGRYLRDNLEKPGHLQESPPPYGYGSPEPTDDETWIND